MNGGGKFGEGDNWELSVYENRIYLSRDNLNSLFLYETNLSLNKHFSELKVLNVVDISLANISDVLC